MHVAGRDHGSAESTGDTLEHPVGTERSGNFLDAPQPVLDRQDQRMGSKEYSRTGRGCFDLHGLGRYDDEFHLPDVPCIGGCTDLHHPIAAGALDPEPPFADRLDMGFPGVNHPDFVACFRQQTGVDGAHRPGAYYSNFHDPSTILSKEI